MIFKGYEIDIQATLNKVEIVSDYSSGDRYKQGLSYPKEQIKKLFFDVRIGIGDKVWDIPYLVTKEKFLTLDFFMENVKIPRDERFQYNYDRNLLIPLHSFGNSPYVKILIQILLLLDTQGYYSCPKERFILKDKDSFFYKNDFKNLENHHAIPYCIRKYLDYVRAPLNYMRIPEIWHIPHINLVNQISDLEVVVPIFSNDISHKTYSYNLLPLAYSCSFKNLNLPPQKEKFSYEVSEDVVIFKGNYEECFSILTNPANLKKLEQEVYKKDRELMEKENSKRLADLIKNHDYDRDQFDAMTEGRLGSYDDYYGRFD